MSRSSKSLGKKEKTLKSNGSSTLENAAEKRQAAEYLATRLWLTRDLTYSFSITTPDSKYYRLDGFQSSEEARKAQDNLGRELESRGEGLWSTVTPKHRDTYNRRGPRSSADSYLTDAVMNGDSRLQLRDDSLPHLPGRRMTQK